MSEIVLKDGIEIQCFDGFESEHLYIVLYQNRKWKISEIVADIINILQKTSSTDETAIRLKQKYPNTNLDMVIEYTVTFLKSNGLLNSYNFKQKIGKKSSVMWGKKQ